MKKIILLFALCFTSINFFGQTSNLTIFSEEGTPFYLILNGVRQNQNPETNIRVNDLINEYYTAKIIFNKKDMLPVEKKYLQVVDLNKTRGEVTYKITRTNKGKIKLRYFSFTPALQVIPPPMHVHVVAYNTAPMPDIVYTETTTTTTTNVGAEESVGVQINMGGIGIDANININDPNAPNSSTTTTTTTTTTTSAPVAGYPPSGVEIIEEVGCRPMHRPMFQNALQSIQSKTFSETQLTLSKQIVSANCLTANQIKQIAQIFDFEDTKLELAKYAYAYCFDPQNYWQINDVFDFESTIEDLNEYISGR